MILFAIRGWIAGSGSILPDDLMDFSLSPHMTCQPPATPKPHPGFGAAVAEHHVYDQPLKRSLDLGS
jgi:hypothetical protein